MATIDVLIVVDALRILKDYGQNDAPSSGNYRPLGQGGEGQGYVYMIVTWYDAWGEASSELDVFAKAGDTIRWRMTTTSMGTNYQCFIKEFVINSGAQYIAPPQPGHEIIEVPQIDTSALPSVKTILKPIDDVYWETTVRGPGPVTYHTKFALCSGGGGGGGGGGDGGGGGGGDCGGYQWDPFINRPR